jgi:hypothetical protein
MTKKKTLTEIDLASLDAVNGGIGQFGQTLIGIGAGAAVGSAFPGPGTLIGAVVGGFIGAASWEAEHARYARSYYPSHRPYQPSYSYASANVVDYYGSGGYDGGCDLA